MMIRWQFQAHYLLILTHFISAQPQITIKNEKTVYAMLGSRVILQCCILKEDGIHITQTQWSKVDAAPPSRIAVYNPLYGTEYLYFARTGYNHSVNFSRQCQHHQPDLNRTSSLSHSTAIHSECNEWSLQLDNVSLEQAGQYECSFATYPAGIRSSEINLIIKKPVMARQQFKISAASCGMVCPRKTEKLPLSWLSVNYEKLNYLRGPFCTDEGNSVVEILLNQMLDIPCFEGMNSSFLANASLKWLMKEPGNEDILITKQPFYTPGYRTNDTIYKERIHVSPENTLRISPVSILDDGKKFVCNLTYHPGMKSTTEVKVFVKPEIPIVLHKSLTGKATLTCVIRKAFPKPNLLWYMDRKILRNNSQGMFLKNEDIKDEEGFHEMRSVLTIWDASQPPIPQIFRCIAEYPFPGNELRNVSSEEIHLPLWFQTTSLAAPEIISQVTPVSDLPREGHLYATTSLQEIIITKVSRYSTVPKNNLSTKRVTGLTSQTIPSSSPTVKGGFNLTDHLSTQRVTELTSRTSHHSSPTIKGGFDIADNLSATRATELTSLVSPGNSPTAKGGLNITGVTMNPGPRHFSWPAFVAALLFICSSLMILGIRKWCHYQKEIMNRPPSFKPPPPPVKYTSMQECEGAYPSCQELENL